MIELPISIFMIQASQGELHSGTAVEPDTAKTGRPSPSLHIASTREIFLCRRLERIAEKSLRSAFDHIDFHRFDANPQLFQPPNGRLDVRAPAFQFQTDQP